MKFIIVSILIVLVAATSAHPPSSSEEDSEQQKTISEKSNEKDRFAKNLLVKFYYEALCPDSRTLMADLGREYFPFRKYLKLDFVPFGRAESLDANGDEFKCHHGPKECYGNMLHSCSLKYLQSQDARQQFVVCQMRTDAEQTGKECFEEAGGEWEEADSCINGKEGKQLQLQAEVDTKEISKPKLKNVPTVVFNDVYDEELQDKSMRSLKRVFCELLSEKNLPECE